MPKYRTRAQRIRLLKKHSAISQAELVRILADARGRIRGRIITAASNGKFAAARRIRDGLFADIAAEYAALGGRLEAWTDATIKAVGRPFFDLAGADLAATGADRAAASFTIFSRRHLEGLSTVLNPFNAQYLAGVGLPENRKLAAMRGADVAQLRRAVRESIMQATAEGLTPAETYRLMRGAVEAAAGDLKAWQFIDASGRRWKTGNYFEMLNRTVANQAARSAYNNALADEGRDLVQIIGGESEDSAEACKEYNGLVVSLTGQTPGFRTLDDYVAAGGFHPNCVHQTAYVSPTFGPHVAAIERSRIG